MTAPHPDSAEVGDDLLHRLARRHARAYATYSTLRWLAVDALIAIAAAWIAVALRFDRLLPTGIFVSLLPWVLLPAVVIPITNLMTGIRFISWRHPSPVDVLLKTVSTLIALGITLLIFYGIVGPLGLNSIEAFPRSFWPLQAAVAIVLALLVRSRHAWWAGRGAPADRRRHTRTILYGAGEAGIAVAREANSNPGSEVLPVAFLDDDRLLWQQQVAGLPVLGSSAEMGSLAAQVRATQVLISMPSAPGTAVRRVVDAANGAGLKVRTVPSLGELISGSIDPARIRNVKVEDLLRRPASEHELEQVRTLISGRRVLVTGAAGSIGAEILRQALDAEPALLVAFDQAESGLFEIEREMQDRIQGAGLPAGVFVAELGSVADAARLRDLFARYPVDVVVHAAAYKHVPMLEVHPAEAVVTNVGGTLALLDRARESGVQRFVFVSTDKAVNPTSVMGATKRLAELAVVVAGQRFGWDAIVVRFGNVLGSSGSVIPIFEGQLARGAPITITHPDATRFFMTIPEASQLVLSAGALGGPGMTYVLKMGEPVRIVDLAQDLIRLSGFQEGAVEIQYIGLRPGERLHETLFNDSETDEVTPDSRVLMASSVHPPPDTADRLYELVARARRRQVTGAEVIDLALELGGEVQASTGSVISQEAAASTPRGHIRAGSPSHALARARALRE